MLHGRAALSVPNLADTVVPLAEDSTRNYRQQHHVQRRLTTDALADRIDAALWCKSRGCVALAAFRGSAIDVPCRTSAEFLGEKTGIFTAATPTTTARN
jgi:hypothetical protein